MGKRSKKLSREEIKHLAKLASLDLTEEEIEKFRDQLGETIDYVENLNELKTEGVKPTSYVLASENVRFEDGKENTRGLSTDEALSNAKNKSNGFFKVKKILSKD